MRQVKCGSNARKSPKQPPIFFKLWWFSPTTYLYLKVKGMMKWCFRILSSQILKLDPIECILQWPRLLEVATKLKTDLSTCDDGINDLYQQGMVKGFSKENLVRGMKDDSVGNPFPHTQWLQVALLELDRKTSLEIRTNKAIRAKFEKGKGLSSTWILTKNIQATLPQTWV